MSRRASVRALLVAGAILAVPGAPATSASPSPSLTATTSAAGHVLPKAAVNGSWQQSGGVWSLDLGAVTPAESTTTITATWTSPTMTLQHGAQYFGSSIDVAHQGQAATAMSYVFRARTCVKKRCEPWTTYADSEPLQYAEPGVLPYFVSTGGGVDFSWDGRTTKGFVQWQCTLKQSGVDAARIQLAVAAGNAAKSFGGHDSRQVTQPLAGSS